MANVFHDPLGANSVRRSNGAARPAPLLFPSDPWVQAWIDIANSHPAAPDLRARLTGHWRFVVDRDRTGPGGVWELAVRPDGIVLVEAGQGVDSSALRAQLRASHERWYKLLTGKADLRMSILTRRMSVVGDLKELRGYAKELQALGLTPGLVPTYFVNQP